ncbi:histidinol dehydrogenase [Tahibacter amnicola]|uniref:Histidinol dehydrogenase n=1 Tax=Tahibacter amnicola TaxID=2976241 RepID=A0ABY6BB77_9GAMM|nr:histidinol dehydrogenase [Tahibacter amnicola]UXI67110.1 histidinol dehydrogenase [Tahibacter amnicola]
MNRISWNTLDAAARTQALARPRQSQNEELTAAVARLLAQVRADGDATLRALTRRYDGCELATLAVSDAEFDAAEAQVPVDLKQAIDEAAGRISTFHRKTAPQDIALETAPGVLCERILRPLSRVGFYVPAGTAPLPSTVLMLAVPAGIAGCDDIILCTPPDRDGRCDPVVLYAARRLGVRRVFKLGGAQAIAAMAYGTESVPRCDKLFGPGNAWVTEAKRQVAADPSGVPIDMPAGPSEVLVIADASADPEFVAADLLSQAEHGSDSQVILVSTSERLIEAVALAVDAQLATLPRANLARDALAHSRLIQVDDLESALQIANQYAPEHLILNVEDARRWLPQVRNAGSVFLGPWSPEAIGDYCSGTNHVLPTFGHARAWSGVSVASFVKLITVQELEPRGLRHVGPCAETLARTERLHAHERAVTLRLQRLAEVAP